MEAARLSPPGVGESGRAQVAIFDLNQGSFTDLCRFDPALIEVVRRFR